MLPLLGAPHASPNICDRLARKAQTKFLKRLWEGGLLVPARWTHTKNEFYLLKGKRQTKLSITHKFGPHDETKFNVCESGQTSPDDAIPGRSIARTGQIAAQSGEFG